MSPPSNSGLENVGVVRDKLSATVDITPEYLEKFFSKYPFQHYSLLFYDASKLSYEDFIHQSQYRQIADIPSYARKPFPQFIIDHCDFSKLINFDVMMMSKWKTVSDIPEKARKPAPSESSLDDVVCDLAVSNTLSVPLEKSLPAKGPSPGTFDPHNYAYLYQIPENFQIVNPAILPKNSSRALLRSSTSLIKSWCVDLFSEVSSKYDSLTQTAGVLVKQHSKSFIRTSALATAAMMSVFAVTADSVSESPFTTTLTPANSAQTVLLKESPPAPTFVISQTPSPVAPVESTDTLIRYVVKKGDNATTIVKKFLDSGDINMHITHMRNTTIAYNPALRERLTRDTREFVTIPSKNASELRKDMNLLYAGDTLYIRKAYAQSFLNSALHQKEQVTQRKTAMQSKIPSSRHTPSSSSLMQDASSFIPSTTPNISNDSLEQRMSAFIPEPCTDRFSLRDIKHMDDSEMRGFYNDLTVYRQKHTLKETSALYTVSAGTIRNWERYLATQFGRQWMPKHERILGQYLI